MLYGKCEDIQMQSRSINASATLGRTPWSRPSDYSAPFAQKKVLVDQKALGLDLMSRSRVCGVSSREDSAHLLSSFPDCPQRRFDVKMDHHSFASGANQQSPQSAIQSTHRDSDAGKFESPQDTWSGEESGGEADNQDGPRKRRRPMSVSCELCKQRKVKCDRGQPSCGWCSRNDQVCEYKERKKPGLRAGYGRELEQRLDRLEDIIQSHGRLLEASLARNGHHVCQASVPQDMPTFRSPTESQQPHMSRPDTALFLQKPPIFTDIQQDQGPNMVDYQGSLTAPTPSMQQSNGYPQQGSSHSMQPDMTSMSQTPQDYYSHTDPPLESPSLNIPNGAQPQFSSPDHDLPPYDLLYALADLYFKHINTWCPILHRRTTLDALFGPSTLDEADRILLHAIVATTLRFSTDSRLNEENRRRFHDTSKQKVLLYGLENSSVKALQALVILALDLVGSSNGPPGWNLLALITRSVVQLGLAVEITSASVSPSYPSIYTLRAMVLPESRSWIEDEGRRRLFWMVYLLDRYATIATAFEFALDEKEIDRKLPCRDDLFSRNQAVDTRWFRTTERTDYAMNKPENLGSFSYYIEILGILSKIHQFLKKPVDISALSDVEQWQGQYRELENIVTSWKFSLPSEYGNMARLFNSGGGNKIVNCGWVMLHATYQTTVIRLHSSAAYPTTRSLIFTPSYSAGQRCQTAVENIAALGQYVVSNGMLNKLGPPFAFTLWVAARLLLVHGSTIEHHVSPDIHFFVDTLREMGRYWKVAERYTTILQRVLDEHRESERAVGANGERVTPSSVKILADMRRCAYDLDFLISRQPRHHVSIASVTPARTPATNELEYLDVFDFFNVPRLPAPSIDGSLNGANSVIDPHLQVSEVGNTSNEFNITNFMVDANSDWLFKNSIQR
ncbi:MAG: hypothetical protein M1830_000218 [Pleopsidium flavum]|nr:MAG: hypothetical protein M1830_000218 [Pleopsidium flavum]